MAEAMCWFWASGWSCNYNVALMVRIEASLPGAPTRELLTGRVNYPSPAAGSPYHRSARCASHGVPTQGAEPLSHGLIHGGGNRNKRHRGFPFHGR